MKPAQLAALAGMACYAFAMGDFTRLDGRKDRIFQRVETPAGDVMLTDRFMEDIVDGHPPGRERFADRVIPTLTDPAEIWLTAIEMKQGIVYQRVYISAFEDGCTAAVVAEEQQPYGWVSRAFSPGSPEEGQRFRQGYLLHQRGWKNPGPSRG